MVSIIICTRNRAESLRRTLEAIARVQVPPDLPAELLVVDNGSTDHTGPVARDAGLANMPVRLVHEPRPGKGYAYNTGVAAARGGVLLFTDDDVRPPGDWIEGMCRPIAAGEADAVAGGVVFPAEYEPHLSREPYASRRGWFASTEGIDPMRPDRMVGANMAIGRHVFAEVPGFDESLGPGGLGFIDETLLSWQIVERGFRLAGRLHVAVEHHFELSRLNRSSLLSMAKRMGRSEAYVRWHWHHNATMPTARTFRRARWGLLKWRLLCPLDILMGRVAEWELERVFAISYWKQVRVEASRPRKYGAQEGQRHEGTEARSGDKPAGISADSRWCSVRLTHHSVPSWLRGFVPDSIQARVSSVRNQWLGGLTHVETDQPVAALTFDDGPHRVHTPQVLDLLEKHGARATFFMLGRAAGDHPDLVREVAQRGHGIANHTWDHPVMPLLNARQRRQQVHRTQAVLAPHGVRLFRPPFGKMNGQVRLELSAMRYCPVLWGVSAHDWEEREAQWMANALLRQVRPGSIILLHDGIFRGSAGGSSGSRDAMLEALGIFLAQLRGYEFVTIPELLRRGQPRFECWL